VVLVVLDRVTEVLDLLVALVVVVLVLVVRPQAVLELLAREITEQADGTTNTKVVVVVAETLAEQTLMVALVELTLA
jgi:hypothetical protein